MPSNSDFFSSVEHIWFIWFVSLVITGVMTVQALHQLNWRSFLYMHREEDGAAYSLAYIMTFPIYVMFVCLVVETTLILIVKIGTVYGAYACARSYVVFHSLDSGLAQDRFHQAAVMAMAPFGSSNKRHLDGNSSGTAANRANDYVAGAQAFFQNQPINLARIRNKYLYANQATAVTAIKTGNQPQGVVEITLRYQTPLHVPGVTRFLGKRSPRGGGYYIIEMETKASLPDEAPNNEHFQPGPTSMGILYEAP